MSGIAGGRVVVVTGSGRGIGRGEAIEFARQGAKVVVADVGVALDGSDPSGQVAEQVVAEIKDLGGEAVACLEDVGDFDASRRILDTAISTYGRLDVLVNNAGIIRDKMIFNMDEGDFDAVIRVHLKGTFNLCRWAAIHWRERQKAGEVNDARIVNTCSPSGLYGSAGQANYAAAKAGIAAMTIGLSRELARYGVLVNAVSPVAATRMTATLGRPPASIADGPGDDGWDPRHPDNVAPLVVWLGSTQSEGITGQVFEAGGGRVCVAEGWRQGPQQDKGARWDPAELGPVVRGLVAGAYQAPVPGGGANWRS